MEIKYCRDTKPEDQEARAIQQHRNLVENLQKYDPGANVKHCVLLLGVGGVIYKDVGKQLSENLGVKGHSLDSLLRRLHFQSVEAVGDMWKHRRALLQHKLGTKHKVTGLKRPCHGFTPHHRTTVKRKK